MPALWMGDEMETAYRVDRVTKERSISNADWRSATRRLDALGLIAHSSGYTADQAHRNRMPLRWHLKRHTGGIEWDVAVVWGAIFAVVCIEIVGLWTLADVLIEGVAAWIR